MKKWLPVIVALSMNLLPISAFAGCGGPGNFPGGDNCGLTHQGAPGPVLGGIPVLIGLGGLWAYRRLRGRKN